MGDFNAKVGEGREENIVGPHGLGTRNLRGEKIKTEEVSGARIKLQMWDTAGQDRFRSVASNFYRCANAIVIVFDVRSARSFAEVEGWVAEARRYGPPGCHCLLIGNKVDTNEKEENDLSQRQVTEAEASLLAERLAMSYLETSAKTGRNVQEAFTSLAKQFVHKRREENGGEDPLPLMPGSNNLSRQKGIVLDGSSKPLDSSASNYCCPIY
ncbi:ras-related protein rab-1a [Plakobranchus ocellatus]|uniref:Ras-related protein rab-1a n=1 Tax=Plakobranchus ocellatus TaxID=259542 RepID=A0AAV3YET1_9GAST|nr:ras-related protein rab-1a [Plakobranchus ocellatus]